jgi:hypothetical protein
MKSNQILKIVFAVAILISSFAFQNCNQNFFSKVTTTELDLANTANKTSQSSLSSTESKIMSVTESEVCYISSRGRYICTHWSNLNEDFPNTRTLTNDLKSNSNEFFIVENLADGSRIANSSVGQQLTSIDFNIETAKFNSQFQNLNQAHSLRVLKNCILFDDNSISCTKNYLNLLEYSNTNSQEWWDIVNPSDAENDRWITLTTHFEKQIPSGLDKSKILYSAAVCAITVSGKVDCFGRHEQSIQCEDKDSCDKLVPTEIVRKKDLSKCDLEKCADLIIKSILYSETPDKRAYQDGLDSIKFVADEKSFGSADLVHNLITIKNNLNTFDLHANNPENNLPYLNLNNQDGNIVDLFYSNISKQILCYIHSGGEIRCLWQEGQSISHIEFPTHCPNQIGNNKSLHCFCTSEDTLDEFPIWGTDTYSSNSSICKAALHAGAISDSGGNVNVIKSQTGCTSYPSLYKNSITSLANGPYDSNIYFAGAGNGSCEKTENISEGIETNLQAINGSDGKSLINAKQIEIHKPFVNSTNEIIQKRNPSTIAPSIENSAEQTTVGNSNLRNSNLGNANLRSSNLVNSNSFNSNEFNSTNLSATIEIQGEWIKGMSWGPTCISKKDYEALVLQNSAFRENAPCQISATPSYGNIKFEASCRLANSIAGNQCTQGEFDNYYCTTITSWSCN